MKNEELMLEVKSNLKHIDFEDDKGFIMNKEYKPTSKEVSKKINSILEIMNSFTNMKDYQNFLDMDFEEDIWTFIK